MDKKFKIYRSQLLFIGLAPDEMMSIETAFNRFSVFYKSNLSTVGKLAPYDLICIPEEDFENNQEELEKVKIPFLIIGQKTIKGSAGLLNRPIYIKDWLEIINKLIQPAKTPSLEKIEVGVIVRSKTTPIFGKGIVVSLIGNDEMMVQFPNNPLLPKSKPIRCHKTQLQIIGKVENDSTES